MTVQSDDESPSRDPEAHEWTRQASSALEDLTTRDPALAKQLSALFVAVVSEAARSRGFARSLSTALSVEVAEDKTDTARRPAGGKNRRASSIGERPKNRRLAGVLDPFAIYSESGEEVLRSRLSSLDLELLRDIVAEHGMDNDRLAMKWKDPTRVVDRIVDRVVARSAKGSAFRGDKTDARLGEGD